jgi:hypothetical protein
MTHLNQQDKKSRIFLVAVIVRTIVAAFFLTSVMTSLSAFVSVKFFIEGTEDETLGAILIADNEDCGLSELPIRLGCKAGSNHNFWISSVLSNSNKKYAWKSTEELSIKQSDSITTSFITDIAAGVLKAMSKVPKILPSSKFDGGENS